MASPLPQPAVLESLRLKVHGRVQGVGFRPFVYRLAHQLGLTGWVQNRSGEVEIQIQGDPATLDRFRHALIQDAPPLARPALCAADPIEPESLDDFSIIASTSTTVPDIHVPPDCFTCQDCLQELNDSQARRYRYPFINCTQCGPRYTLIRALPYDRPNTTLADFPLCRDCAREYGNPLDRRFHAQPLACAVCGPRLAFHQHRQPILHEEAALRACVAALRQGLIVAVKGIGGYHLLCDAGNDLAIDTLRERKRRPAKPLAVMFPQSGGDGLDRIRHAVILDEITADRLRDPMRPIVLVSKRADNVLSAALSPGLGELGVFLPYSPLHHLLLQDFGGPLVATSGNISGEPVIIDNTEADQRLPRVADAFLHHNRPIERPADDAVYRIIAGSSRPLRLGRGNAPLEQNLPIPLSEPVLALGGQMKVTVALAWDDRVVISPHIGDLDSIRGLRVFEQVCRDLQRLYGIQAKRLVCDAHPGYTGSRWARRQGLPVLSLFHHRAHASTVAGEYPQIQRWLAFTWDGVGYGSDGTLWGGEALWGRPGQWQHVAGLKPFRLPGGDKAGREPWRAAAALCWETGTNFQAPAISDLPLARHAWERGLNSPVSSAAGRIFDAAAALIMGIDKVSYEGQGPMQLEALAAEDDPCDTAITLPLNDDNGFIRIDWSPLLPLLNDNALSAARRAAIFHNTMADTVVAQALALKERYPYDCISLSGGVFQNRRLSERVIAKLDALKIPVCLPQTVPANDGGLSYGQVIEAAAILKDSG